MTCCSSGSPMPSLCRSVAFSLVVKHTAGSSYGAHMRPLPPPLLLDPRGDRGRAMLVKTGPNVSRTTMIEWMAHTVRYLVTLPLRGLPRIYHVLPIYRVVPTPPPPFTPSQPTPTPHTDTVRTHRLESIGLIGAWHTSTRVVTSTNPADKSHPSGGLIRVFVSGRDWITLQDYARVTFDASSRDLCRRAAGRPKCIRRGGVQVGTAVFKMTRRPPSV